VAELALGKTVSADSSETLNPATAGNDGSKTTRWCAANGTVGHYWTVDLGSAHALTSVEIDWEFDNRAYGYTVGTSMDGTTFTEAVDRTANATMEAFSTVPLAVTARHVRITATALPALPSTTWASFWEVRVFGR